MHELVTPSKNKCVAAAHTAAVMIPVPCLYSMMTLWHWTVRTVVSTLITVQNIESRLFRAYTSYIRAYKNDGCYLSVSAVITERKTLRGSFAAINSCAWYFVIWPHVVCGHVCTVCMYADRCVHEYLPTSWRIYIGDSPVGNLESTGRRSHITSMLINSRRQFVLSVGTAEHGWDLGGPYGNDVEWVLLCNASVRSVLLLLYCCYS